MVRLIIATLRTTDTEHLEHQKLGRLIKKENQEVGSQESFLVATICTTMGRQATGQWRPIAAASSVQCSRPSAPVGEKSPPKPEARPTYSFNILPSYSLEVHTPTPPTEKTPPPKPELETNTPEDPRKLIANILDAVLAALRSTCAAKAEVSLLGRIHGKHPGLKALTAWARDTLHSSLSLLSLKTNNLFEVTFTHPEGRLHALTQADLVCNTAAIFFLQLETALRLQGPQGGRKPGPPSVGPNNRSMPGAQGGVVLTAYWRTDRAGHLNRQFGGLQSQTVWTKNQAANQGYSAAPANSTYSAAGWGRNCGIQV